MTTRRFALRDRATLITIIATLLVAVLTVAPTAARAANGQPIKELAQGVGMGPKPSVRVREVQRALTRRGYDLGRPGVDGRFGPLTDAAVRRMQADYGLAVDGIVGAHTRRALGVPRVGAHDAKLRSRSTLASRTRALRQAAPNKAQSTGNRTGPARGSNTPRQGETSAQRSAAAARAAAGKPHNTNTHLADPATNWLPLTVAGALAGIIAALSALGISSARRRRPRRGRAHVVPPPRAPEPKPSGPPRHGVTDDRPNGAQRLPATAATGQRPRSQLAPGDPVIGYLTIPPNFDSSNERASSGGIEARCERFGWKLLEIVRDRDQGRPLERSGLRYALQRIANGEARGLVVGDLQRFGHSIVNLGTLMTWFRDAHAALIALDVELDTSTPEGQQVASTLIAMSVQEHERLAARTPVGVAEGRANGRSTGRPSVSDSPELLERIAAMRAANMTLQAIADALNAEGVPTLRGGAKWRPSSIQAALGYRRPDLQDRLPVPNDRQNA
jgi:peptidoglycan hydrolase-like protein with peptidoglycan-binding domain/DNA invertase Pin-like site-specific DNA recombinase